MTRIAGAPSQGRPSYLENEAVFEALCQGEAAGFTREQIIDLIMEQTNIEIKQVMTISTWRKNPRVKRRVQEITREQAVKVARLIDKEIDRRMADPESIPTDVLIKLRKEFVGDNLRARMDEADDNTVGEMRDWAAENPDLAKALVESFFTATDK